MSPQPICSIYFGTPAIFRGTVPEKTLDRPPLQTVRNLDGTTSQIIGPGTYKVRLAVSEGFGAAQGKQELTVYTNEQSSACGFPFRVGVEYVVFTYENKQGDQLWTSHCSRTHVLADPAHDSDLEWMRGLPAAPPGATISGHVMLAQAGPMPGAKVLLRSSADHGAANREITPDEKGAYEWKGLPAGEYKVKAALPSGFTSFNPERTITLHDRACALVDYYVSYDGHIRGRAADLDGKPMAHLIMELERKDPNSAGGRSMVDLKEADEDGRYDFGMLAPGDYTVVANNLGASPARPYPRVYYPASETLEGSTPVRVSASESVDGIDVVMPRPWKKVAVTTEVVSEDGTPMPGITVFAHQVKNQSSVEPMTAITGPDGRATLPVYEGQEYYLTALVQGGVQQRCGGPLRFTAHDGVDVGRVKIEHPWGNCLAQLNPRFHP